MPSIILSVRDDQGITQRLLTELTRKRMPIEAVLAYNDHLEGDVKVAMDIPGMENARVAAQRLSRLEDVFSARVVEENIIWEGAPGLLSRATPLRDEGEIGMTSVN